MVGVVLEPVEGRHGNRCQLVVCVRPADLGNCIFLLCVLIIKRYFVVALYICVSCLYQPYI